MLLPPRPPRHRRYPGQLPEDDHAALRGIVSLLRTGVTWADVPAETVGRSGVTGRRRLQDWIEAVARRCTPRTSAPTDTPSLPRGRTAPLGQGTSRPAGRPPY
ncbi:transposase [Streptomyces litmocidini]|uniref:transposase n=1 Tax=Streptomyces litmocidini TaxID=67318 RepID=UPI003F541EC5